MRQAVIVNLEDAPFHSELTVSLREGARAAEPPRLVRSGDIDGDLIELAERRLALIQQTLGLSDSYFEDRQSADPTMPGTEIANALVSRAGVRLIDRFRRIEDPAVREGLLDLLSSLRDLNSSCAG